MFSDDAWVIIIVAAVVLGTIAVVLVKKQKSAGTQTHLRSLGFDATKFYNSVISGHYFAIDENAGKVAVKGVSQTAEGFIFNPRLEKGEGIFPISSLEFADSNTEQEWIEMAAQQSGGKIVVFRISLQTLLDQNECIALLRNLGVGSSQPMDIGYE